MSRLHAIPGGRLANLGAQRDARGGLNRINARPSPVSTNLWPERLCLADAVYPAHLVTCRPEDRTIGTAHWVQFPLDDRATHLLSKMDRPAWFEFDNGTYKHESGRLSEDLRLSLLDDLQLSERSEARLHDRR